MRHLDRLSDEALLAAVGLEERDAAVVFVRRFQRRVFGLAVTVFTLLLEFFIVRRYGQAFDQAVTDWELLRNFERI